MRSAKSRLLGLLAAAVLGALLLAVSAQATTSGFLINKTPVGTLKASITGKQLGRGTLLVAVLNTEINCEKFSIVSGFINITSQGEGQLLYEECSVLTVTGGLVEQPCKIVVNHTGDKKPHITATAILLPAELNDGTPAILAEKISAKVLMEEGTECTLPKTNLISGELCLKLDKNDTSEPELLASEAIQGMCNLRSTLEGAEFSGTLAEREKKEAEGKGFLDKLLFGVNPAFIAAKADISLGGEHTGLALGVGPTPNTMLCKVKTGGCEAYGLGTKLSSSLESEVKFVFPYEGEELEPPCRVSSMSGVTTKEGSVVIGELTALSFKECGGGLCTVTAQHLPYKVAIAAAAEGNGTMTLSSGGSGAPAVAIKCAGLSKCIYGATEMAFTIAGGTPAKLSNSGVALKREEGSAGACGEVGAKWEGVAAVEGKVLYKIASPSPLFVRAI